MTASYATAAEREAGIAYVKEKLQAPRQDENLMRLHNRSAAPGATSDLAAQIGSDTNRDTALQWMGERLFRALTSYARTEQAARGAETFFEGAKYSPKVLQQMSKTDDVLHAFPQSVDGCATKYGQWTTKTGADGKAYQWLEMRGSYGGKTGTFEFIKDSNGVINHRYLKPD